MTCLDRARQSFKGNGGDKSFRGWLAAEPQLGLGDGAACMLIELLDLDRDKWTDALSEALLDALAKED
jgi:hypothetical protein